MPLTRLNNTPSAGLVTYRWDTSGPAAIADKKADQAAHELFDLGQGDHGTKEAPRTYADLSLAEKREILNKHFLSVFINLSKSYKTNADQKIPKDAAIALEDSEIMTA